MGIVTTKDVIMLYSFTIAPLVIFVAMTLNYFFKQDTLSKRRKKKSITRNLMKLFFLMFGIVLFSIVVQYFTASVSTMYLLDGGELLYPFPYMAFGESTLVLPYDVLLDMIAVCTLLFTGAEGVTSSLKTINVPKGTKARLPENKRTRVRYLVNLWLFLFIVSTVYQSLIDPSIVVFEIKKVLLGLSTAITVLFAAEKSSSVLENVELKNKPITGQNA